MKEEEERACGCKVAWVGRGEGERGVADGRCTIYPWGV